MLDKLTKQPLKSGSAVLLRSHASQVLIWQMGFAGKVVNAQVPAGAALSLAKIRDELEMHKPAVLFLCQVCSAIAMISGKAAICCTTFWQPHPLLLKLLRFLSPLMWTAHVLQGESSTGAHQALGGVAEACRAHDTVSRPALPLFYCESSPSSTVYA